MGKRFSSFKDVCQGQKLLDGQIYWMDRFIGWTDLLDRQIYWIDRFIYKKGLLLS